MTECIHCCNFWSCEKSIRKWRSLIKEFPDTIQDYLEKREKEMISFAAGCTEFKESEL